MSFSAPCSFEQISETIGRLVIGTENSRVGLTAIPGTASSDPEYRLGYQNAPLFQIVQPYSPDDRWHVHPRFDGRRVSHIAGNPASPASLREWPAAHRVAGLTTLCSELPQGEYLTVLSRAKPIHAERVLMGNEWVPSGVNSRELVSTDHFYSAIFANHLNSEPDTSAPLVGVVVLNYAGQGGLHGVLFFPVFEPATLPRTLVSELCAVIPLRGPLVVDALAEFSSERTIASRDTWARELGRTFAELLAGAPHASTV